MKSLENWSAPGPDAGHRASSSPQGTSAVTFGAASATTSRDAATSLSSSVTAAKRRKKEALILTEDQARP